MIDMGETRLHFCCTCGAVLNAAEDCAALAGECPACGKIIIVPDNAFVMPDPTQAGGAGELDGTDELSEIGGAEGSGWPPEPAPGLEDDEIMEAPEPLDDSQILGLAGGPGRPGEFEAAEEKAVEALMDAGDPEEVPVEGALEPAFDMGEVHEEAQVDDFGEEAAGAADEPEKVQPADVAAGLDGWPGGKAAVELDVELDAELDAKLDERPDVRPDDGTDEGAEEEPARPRPAEPTAGAAAPCTHASNPTARVRLRRRCW